MKIYLFLIYLITQNVWASPTINEFFNELEQEKIEKDQYTFSAVSNVLSQDEYLKIQNKKSNILQGKLITFNTLDQEGCNAARLEMNLSAEVCIYDPEMPLVSVVVMKPLENRKYFEQKLSLNNLSGKEKVVLSSLVDFSILGAGVMGILYSMPEDVSHWDKSNGFKGMLESYSDKVKAGPVWDHDNWQINFVGHPLSGAFYYSMVRHQGFSAMESATFSFCMSTFFWEYGLEAIAEIPSIQDLILTPLIGSIIGEVFYSWSKSIEANHGKLLGVKSFGKIATVLMNPASSIAHQVNKIAKFKIIKSSDISFVNRSPFINYNEPSAFDAYSERSYIGLQLRMRFN